METITKEQFDNLKVGDTLKNDRNTLLIEAKYTNTIMVLLNEYDAIILSFKEIQEEGYSITKPIQHNCGLPYGDYSDREVVIKVSDISIDRCTKYPNYMRLKSVNNEGFTDNNNNTWKYAVLVTNNVNLVK